MLTPSTPTVLPPRSAQHDSCDAGSVHLWKADAFRYIRLVPQLLIATNNPGKLSSF